MRLLVALMLCVVGVSASTSQINLRATPLPNDAYVWQRVWTPTVMAAARRSSDLVRSWRILVAEADRSGRWTRVSVPWAELRATARPIVAVLRMDGRLNEERMSALLDQVAAMVDDIEGPLAGVEIDYDCPTSRLATYARFLAGLRTRLPASIRLSITALPTWMNSVDLERLVPPLDEMVLQVHAVDEPRRGLFNPARAESRVRDFARRIDLPFRVALPAYDVRVTWHRDGALASVEGEVPLLTGAASGETLRAAPEAVVAFLHAMRRAAPDNLVGVAWFRLPTDADRRAWSPGTWRAVLTDRLSPSRLSASLVPAEAADLWTVTLSNDGAVDAVLPRQVRLDHACTMADGANGFHLVRGEPLALTGSGNGRLRPHDTRIIGWARCTAPRRHLDVAP
jgi:hypothetical protein